MIWWILLSLLAVAAMLLLLWLWGRGSVPRVNSLLFVEPELHHLAYGSRVMEAIVEANAKPEYDVRQLRASDARPTTIDAALAEGDQIFIFGVGHGGPCIYTVECTEHYLIVRSGSHGSCTRNLRLDIMSGRVVHLNSCSTGAELGPALIAHGARAYIGSREPFWLYVGTPPCSDRASHAVFLPEYQIEASLMAGLSVGQAYSDSQARYDVEIEYWTTGPGRFHPHAAGIVRILQIDKAIQVQLGDGGATVCTPIIPPEWSLISLTLGMTPLIGIGAVISSEEIRKFQEWFK